MSIFQEEQLTQEEKLRAIKNEIARFNTRTLSIFKERYLKSLELVWGNKKASPQDILDSYGTSAVELFVTSNAVADFIKSVDPLFEKPIPPYEYTINEDGTVTVGDLIE